MSTTSYNVDYNYSNDNIMNQQPMREISSPIEQLRKRAYVNKADTELYDVRKWVNSVSQLYQQVHCHITSAQNKSQTYLYLHFKRENMLF